MHTCVTVHVPSQSIICVLQCVHTICESVDMHTCVTAHVPSQSIICRSQFSLSMMSFRNKTQIVGCVQQVLLPAESSLAQLLHFQSPSSGVGQLYILSIMF